MKIKKDISKKYAISILLSILYGFFSAVGLFEIIHEKPFGVVLNILIILIFGLIPFAILVEGVFFENRNKTKEQRVQIIRDTFSHLKNWLLFKKRKE